ncbi:2-dehydropantoate 2-reductase [Gillisia sp. M10.2A]|uniref:2-dehydropantoate 2-reductase n=1 Tax=Gillisia lutea TaxID=2909668 RepID=A0ABS9EG22_9FLAO|nr:2-dehydropantoate 2-reductase [Gillisia lutea]MCF4100411.1 2-dehydropantoate 2-reductase [Gillisia lutea]
MQILIYGIGGIGGYFGGRIAKVGYNVSMIARGTHLEAIKKHGLQVQSINGDFTVHPGLVTSNIEEVPQPDLVILGVKSWQIEEVAKKLKPILKKDSIVLPLQNGADNAEKLQKILPSQNVLAGLCRIVSFVEAPGKIKHPSFNPSITFGELDNSRSKRVLDLKALFNKAEIENIIPDNIHMEIWKKFLFISMISALGGLTRVSLDIIRNREYLRGLMEKTGLEIIAVADAKGINLSTEHLKMAFEALDKQPAGTTASTQRDIMAGKPSELENFNGYIVRQGKSLNVPTPINTFIYECLLPMEIEARKA